MKLLCAPAAQKYPEVTSDLRIDLFTNSGFKSRGHTGALIAERIRRAKLNPSQRAWDLLSLALAVVAAYHAHHRTVSPDGWTREVHITVGVSDPAFWNTQTGLIKQSLDFLTTDIWGLDFVGGGYAPDANTGIPPSPEDCVVLLSGGLDSLIGAIDLTMSGKKALAVSHIVRRRSKASGVRKAAPRRRHSSPSAQPQRRRSGSRVSAIAARPVDRIPRIRRPCSDDTGPPQVQPADYALRLRKRIYRNQPSIDRLASRESLARARRTPWSLLCFRIS